MSTDTPPSSSEQSVEQDPAVPQNPATQCTYQMLDSAITEQIPKPDVPAILFKFEKENHVRTLIDNMRLFWSKKQMIDIHIVGEDKQMYEFHMILLAGYSTIFRKIFSHIHMQWFSGILAPRGVKSDRLEALQNCLYEPGMFYTNIANAQSQNNTALMEFATFFGLEELAVNAFLDCQRVLANWSEMMEQRFLTFSLLKAGESEIPCHGLILASCSPVFRDQVPLGDTEDILQLLYNVFEVEGVYQDNIIKKLIQFVYNAEIEIDSNCVIELLYSSCMLRMLSVAKACCLYIKNTLTPEICVGFLDVEQCALDINNDTFCNVLFENTEQFIIDHFSEVMFTVGFQQKLDEKSIVKYMAKANLDEVERSTVIQALLQWQSVDEGRIESLARLMALLASLKDHNGLRNVLIGACDHNKPRLAYLKKVASGLPTAAPDDQGQQ